jgi:hypothetical protein
MPSNTLTPLRRELRRFLVGFGGGVLFVPLLVYIAGALTLGPYEGGLFAFLGHLYKDLIAGAPGALILVVSPYGFDALWRASRALADRAGEAPKKRPSRRQRGQ